MLIHPSGMTPLTNNTYLTLIPYPDPKQACTQSVPSNILTYNDFRQTGTRPKWKMYKSLQISAVPNLCDGTNVRACRYNKRLFEDWLRLVIETSKCMKSARRSRTLTARVAGLTRPLAVRYGINFIKTEDWQSERSNRRLNTIRNFTKIRATEINLRNMSRRQTLRAFGDKVVRRVGYANLRMVW
jgi:hypothetical protein